VNNTLWSVHRLSHCEAKCARIKVQCASDVADGEHWRDGSIGFAIQRVDFWRRYSLAAGFFVAAFADLAEAFGLAVTRADFFLADFFFAAFAMY